MGNARDTGYLQNIVTYDANDNIVLPANLNVGGAITTSAGFFNFGNNYGIKARNFQDTAYRTVFKLNTSNQIEIGRDTNISDIILGTASATNALTIASTGAATFNTTSATTSISMLSTGTASGLRLQNVGGTESDWIIQSDGGVVAGQAALRFYSITASTYRMSIDGFGNVGIGTTTIPNRLGNGTLQLGTTMNLINIANQTYIQNNWYYAAGTNTATHIINGASSRFLMTADGSFIFTNTSSGTANQPIATEFERMRISSGGHVGIKITPNSGWGSAMAALQIGNGGVIDNWTGSDSSMSVGVNYYDNGSGAQLRLYAKGVSKIGFDQNIITLSNAASSSAGSTITWAERMSINGDGNFRINNLSTGAVYSSSGTLTNTAPLITATGGTITTSGGFRYHTFTSSGTFQVTAGSGLIEVFVLGGGGAGGGDASGSTFYGGGGGSGGGLYNPAYYVEVSSYTVTVGAGGTPNVLSNGFGGDGNNSSFANVTALGGGGGSRGNADSSSSFLGRNGGSGGGGGSSNGVAGISTQAISNGVAYGNSGAQGAGIGGAGGGIGTQPGTAGFGGLGRYIFNLANRIGGGGGAGTFSNSGGNGRDGAGNGGYWNGSNDSNSGGTAGTANTGGGGGGLGYPTGLGGAGGSGIVIVRYKV
jgi:hypothetical protein